ncbi:unnamed protein product, partial [Ixodes pacificus]
SCVAWGCSERTRKCSAIGFYRFPARPTRRSAWTDAVKRKNWSPVWKALSDRSTYERSRPPGIRSEHFRVQTA